MASIPLFLHILSIFLPSLPVFSHLCLVSAIFAYFSSIFACFGVITQQILPNVKTGITVWHKRMVHQLGRTEMDNLAPHERIFFWQNRIEFWQKEIVGPPKKCPKNAYDYNWFSEVSNEGLFSIRDILRKGWRRRHHYLKRNYQRGLRESRLG